MVRRRNGEMEQSRMTMAGATRETVLSPTQHGKWRMMVGWEVVMKVMRLFERIGFEESLDHPGEMSRRQICKSKAWRESSLGLKV